MEKKEQKLDECCGEKYKYDWHKKHYHGGGGHHGNAIYGLGVIGALFYFLQNTTTFVSVLLGIGKAVFWPAILMFKLLTYLNL
jgi:hypothetical protein